MPLALHKKGEAVPLPEGAVSRVQLSPYRVELAGIRTVAAAREPLVRELRTVGYVAVDESRRSRIVVRIGGYLEELYVDKSFVDVAKDQPLASIYSPELYAAANDLLVASRQRSATTSRLLDATRERLRLLGVADQEIDEILKSGEAKSQIVLRSPHAGRMFLKNAVEGDRVEPGQMLFEVADLSVVWIESDVFEKDASFIHVGAAMEATIDAYPGEVFRGNVALMHPHVQTATRTLRVRFELPNPDGKLHPGMFANVTLKTPVSDLEPFRDRKRAEVPLAGAEDGKGVPATEADMQFVSLQGVCPVTGAKLGSMGTPVKAAAGDRALFLCCAGCEDELAARPDYYLDRMQMVGEDGVLSVPESAVIDTGTKKIVYVEREPGLFEGVEVTLGPLAEGKYAVLDGILPGDRVAAAGAFLVDAETRLNPSASAAYFGAAGGPASGSGSSSSGSQASAAVQDDEAKEREAALAKLSPVDRVAAERQKICPVTGMSLGTMGTPVKIEAGGKTVYLCCEGCRDLVLKDPAAAIEKIRAAGGEVAEAAAVPASEASGRP
jgi:Cu(I)/Ag(I) efflux system membrane fusion protein